MKQPEQILTGLPEDLKEKNGASTRRKQFCIKRLLEAIRQAEEAEEQGGQETPQRDENNSN